LIFVQGVGATDLANLPVSDLTANATEPAVAPSGSGASSGSAGVTRGLGFLLLVIWCALLTGLLDASIMLGQRFGLRQITGQTPDGIWMAPLAYSVLFALPAAIVAAATIRATDRIAFRWRVGVLAFLSWGSLLLFLYQRIHRAALLLLAFGLCLQTVRLAWAHRAGLALLVRRTVPVLGVAVAALGVALPGARRLTETRALAALPAPPAAGLNVLFIILDTVRARSLGLFGAAVANTPRLEAMAANGVMFERAIANAPWTLASHASMFTGRPVHEVGVDFERSLDDRYPTLAEVLRERGYLTAGFTANFFYTTWESGLQRGFVHYDAQPVTPSQVLKSSALGQYIEHLVFGFSLQERTSPRRSAGDINQAFLRWLGDAQERPFFAFLNYLDAHRRYQAPEPFRSRYRAGLSDVHAYQAAIAYEDHEVGLLLDSLAARGVLRNTLVIVTSDHGEMLGEHGLIGHTKGLYLPLLRVPLVLSLPGRIPTDIRVAGTAPLQDLAGTILDVLGTAGAPALPGRSLVSRWAAPDTAPSDIVLSEYSAGGARSLFDGRLHYLRQPDGKESLFDVSADPAEMHDLAKTSDPATLAAFRAHLEAIMGAKTELH